MTDDKKRGSKPDRSEVDLDLGNLLGPLGEALGNMLSKLEAAQNADTQEDRTFQTEKGPVKAQAGLRVRVGGLPGSKPQRKPPPRPVNPDRSARPQPEAPQASVMAFEYDIFETEEGWMLTADLPGVAQDELQIEGAGRKLTISSNGTRRYRADIDLQADFDPKAIVTSLHNGILDLRIPRLAPGGDTP